MRVRSSIVGVLILLAAFLVGTGPADAIINGAPDGTAHPYVGIIYTEQLFCSSVAISPTVLLTAAHCLEEGNRFSVSFDADPQPREADGWPSPAAAVTTGTGYPIGDYCGLSGNPCGNSVPAFFSTSDVAVVVLDGPVSLPRYAKLPDPNQVDQLRTGQQLTSIGYGVDARLRGGGRPVLLLSVIRRTAPVRLIPTNNSITPVTVRAQSTGQSGTCYGDSGSPLLLGDTVLGVLSGGVAPLCNAPSYYSRIDTPQILAAIGTFE